jgi:esterase/lipase superfamily enzyme
MNQKFILSLRDQEMGGAVTSGHLYGVADGGQLMDWEANLQEFTRMTCAGNQRLLVLLHGFNNTYEVGRQSLTQYMDLIAAGGNEDVMLAVLWPGDGWAKALTYPFEGRDADDSARALCRWLTVNVDKNASVSFIAHSLGCRVAMEAAQRLVWSGNSPRLGRICLMAPAIDNDSLGKMCVTCYRDATLAAERVAVLASREDRVLQFSYPLGDLAQTILYGERWGKALGSTGPDEHDAGVLAKIAPVPKADPSRSIDHHDYLGLAQNDKPPHTKSESEKFALEFFKPVDKPAWPGAQPKPAATTDEKDQVVRP